MEPNQDTLEEERASATVKRSENKDIQVDEADTPNHKS